MQRVLLKHPITQRKAWFNLPMYFGELVKIGHSGSYDELIEIVGAEGLSVMAGLVTLYDLEKINQEARC